MCLLVLPELLFQVTELHTLLGPNDSIDSRNSLQNLKSSGKRGVSSRGPPVLSKKHLRPLPRHSSKDPRENHGSKTVGEAAFWKSSLSFSLSFPYPSFFFVVKFRWNFSEKNFAAEIWTDFSFLIILNE